MASMIYFVTHYIAMHQGDAEKIKSYTPGFHLADSPEILLKEMYETVSKQHPHCKKILLTDMNTEIQVPEDVEVIRFPISTNNVILSQLESYIAFFKRWDRHGHIIFLDWDMLIMDNLEHIFAIPYDILFTVRKDKVIPINTGFIALPKDCSKNVVSLLEHVKEKVRRCPENDKHSWAIDQFSFSEMFYPFIRDDKEVLFSYANLRIRLVPCSTYNFTPKEFSIEERYPGAKVLHFKGRHKSLMKEYKNKWFGGSP